MTSVLLQKWKAEHTNQKIYLLIRLNRTKNPKYFLIILKLHNCTILEFFITCMNSDIDVFTIII